MNKKYWFFSAKKLYLSAAIACLLGIATGFVAAQYF